MKYYKDFANFYYFIFFLVILIIFRLIPHPPNFSPIISFAVLSPLLLNSKIKGALVTLLAMIITDLIIGFHPYQLIIYSSLLFFSFISTIKKSYTKLFLTSIISSIVFFIATNFAVWVLWDYYPKTIDGLLQCYILALPFFQNTLLSTLFFTSLIIFLYKYLEATKIKISNLIKIN